MKFALFYPRPFFTRLCSISRPCSSSAIVPTLPLRSRSKFTRHDFIDDKLVEAGRWSTRLNQYIAQLNCTHDPLHPYTITYNQFYPVINYNKFIDKLPHCPTNQLAKLIIDWYVWRTNPVDPDLIGAVLSALDDECLRRANDLDQTQLLSILYAFLYVTPNKLVRLDFYDAAVHRLATMFRSDQSKCEFVQVCHYLGLRKQNTISTVLMQALLRRHLNKFIDKMTIMDVAILATATFRSSTKMQINHARYVESQLLGLDGRDDALLVALVKTVRLNGCRSPAKIHHHLRELIVAGRLSHLQFRGLTHVMAFFADNLIKDSMVIKHFIDECMRKVHTDYAHYQDGNARDLPNDMRAKDFSNFLWCLASLNVSEQLLMRPNDGGHLEQLERMVVDKMNAGQYDYDELVDVTLSLWMLGCHSKPLVSRLMYERAAYAPPEHRQRVRFDSRKNLLFACIEIAEPAWLDEFKLDKRYVFQPEYPAQDYLLEKAPNLMRSFELCRAMHNVKLVKPIRELNIPCMLLTASGGTHKFLDVFEANTVLSDGQTPFGLLALKQTLLRASGCNTVLINTINKTDAELMKIINSEVE